MEYAVRGAAGTAVRAAQAHVPAAPPRDGPGLRSERRCASNALGFVRTWALGLFRPPAIPQHRDDDAESVVDLGCHLPECRIRPTDGVGDVDQLLTRWDDGSP